MRTWLFRLATGFAICGGIVLSLVSLLVVISVLGRMLFLLPVPGDFEIVGMGTAISIFLFLPYCQLRRGHVTVDLFLSHGSARLQRILDRCADCLFALLSLAFAQRMTVGFGEFLRQGDVTMIVSIPLWYAYPFAIASLLLLTACCLHTAWADEVDS